MKTNTKQRPPPPPPNRSVPRPPAHAPITPKQHLWLLVGLLAFWLCLFVLVLIEHARSWARLLPVIGVVIILYGAYVTRKIIKDIKNNSRN
jgi:hypothetical protein